MISEHVSAHHLSRKAVIYVRQSTPNQVLTNQESTRLQYALRQRAVELGWNERDIEVIDTDLGLTARSAANRQGFTDLIGRVTLGEIGLILSWEVTRLSRNCTDWYPLLDLCGYYDCRIADRDGVYNAGTANGRLLLGLKGTISEIEMHTLRGRLTAGLLNKAERGDLALTLPAGLERDPTGVVTKDPNQEVQNAIALVFSTFLDRRSAGQTLRALLDHALLLPRRDRYGTIRWCPPTVSAIIAILKNPAYAGTFVYGRRCPAPARSRSHARARSGGSSCPTGIRPTSPGRRSRRSRTCCATTMRSTTATRPAAFPAPAPPCCMVWSIVASAAIRWSCSTRPEPATSAITCASNTACRSASISPPIRSTLGWWPRSSKPWHPPNWKPGSRPGRRSARPPTP